MKSTLKPKRAFRFHFNRINMQRGKVQVWTVHVEGKCIQTEQILCKVPVKSIFKPLARQPRAYFAGKGRVYEYRGRVDIL